VASRTLTTLRDRFAYPLTQAYWPQKDLEDTSHLSTDIDQLHRQWGGACRTWLQAQGSRDHLPLERSRCALTWPGCSHAARARLG